MGESLEVSGLDHVYLSVRDLPASVAFYDSVMRLLGFKKGTLPIAGEPHAHYFNRWLQISLRRARSREPHDPYRAGLHHLCLRVDSHEAVDRAARELVALGVEASAPRLYPEYAEDYYATFFEDPDGLRLEIVAMTKMRRLLRERWDELDAFEDPLRKRGLVP